MWNLLNNTVTIQARSVSTGATGNSYSYTTTFKNVPVSMQQGSAPASLHDDGRKIVAQYSLYTTQAITASPGDRVLAGNKTLVIQNVKNLNQMNRVFVIDVYEFIDE